MWSSAASFFICMTLMTGDISLTWEHAPFYNVIYQKCKLL